MGRCGVTIHVENYPGEIRGDGRRECFVGDTLTLVGSTFSLVRKPAGSQAQFDGRTISIDAPGVYRVLAQSGERFDLVAFDRRVLDLEQVARADRFRDRTDAERRLLLRAIVNDPRVTPERIEAAQVDMLYGLNAKIHGSHEHVGLNWRAYGG